MNEILFKITLRKVKNGELNIEDIKNQEIKERIIRELE